MKEMNKILFVASVFLTLTAYADPSKQSLNKLQQICTNEIKQGSFSNCVLVLQKNSKKIILSSSGIALGKRYDWSSITKTVSAMIAAMLADQKKLPSGLDSSVAEILSKDNSFSAGDFWELNPENPGLAALKKGLVLNEYFCETCKDSERNLYSYYKGVSIRDLLSHKSGIPAKWGTSSEEWVDFFHRTLLRDLHYERMAQKAAGEFEVRKYNYADNNYILLGRMLQVAGRTSDQEKEKTLVTLNSLVDELKKYLGITADFSFPAKNSDEKSSDRTIAWFKEPQMGHAGLFGDTHALVALINGFLKKAASQYNDKQCSGAFCELLLASLNDSQQEYGLGFEVTSSRAKSARSTYYTPGSSLGHTGFSGVSFWMEPNFADISQSALTIVMTDRSAKNPTARLYQKEESRTEARSGYYVSRKAPTPNTAGTDGVNKLREEASNLMNLF